MLQHWQPSVRARRVRLVVVLLRQPVVQKRRRRQLVHALAVPLLREALHLLELLLVDALLVLAQQL